jgi:hypothetical protein
MRRRLPSLIELSPESIRPTAFTIYSQERAERLASAGFSLAFALPLDLLRRMPPALLPLALAFLLAPRFDRQRMVRPQRFEQLADALGRCGEIRRYGSHAAALRRMPARVE